MQVPEVVEMRVVAPAESIFVDGGAGRRNLPHKLSDLPPHRIIDAIAVADARHTDISSKRESSIASVDVLAKMRIGCEERSEAAR